MEQSGVEAMDREGSDPKDDRPRGREASIAKNRHHQETINAMEKVAKTTQRRLRELEVFVKTQDAQLERMEEAATEA
eukprot:2278779-Heterocapsa_arctica.AAC.1